MNLVEKSILITGAAGFIGSHLCEKLVDSNKILALDNFQDFYARKMKEQNLQNLLPHRNFHFREVDIRDAKPLGQMTKNIDLIFHEAAQPGLRYSLKNPRVVHDINVNGTLNVLEAARINEVEKIIFASSSSVYGVPKYLPLDETHPTSPYSPYAASKLAAEHYCTAYHTSYGLNVVSLRYFSVYGPRQRPDLVIRAVTERLMNNQSPIIFGDGSYTRDFTFIDDIVNGTILAAETDSVGGKIFNLGFGQRTSILEIVQKLQDLLKKQHLSPIYKPAYPGDFPHTQAEISKAKQILGYRPTTSLKQGLKQFLEWWVKAH
ncbi:MAG: GDP-mannose 4,6-dehydratase [Candidatus Hodarchaeota archaeon]